MWNLKNKTNERINRTETDSDTEIKLTAARGERWQRARGLRSTDSPLQTESHGCNAQRGNRVSDVIVTMYGGRSLLDLLITL